MDHHVKEKKHVEYMSGHQELSTSSLSTRKNRLRVDVGEIYECENLWNKKTCFQTHCLIYRNFVGSRLQAYYYLLRFTNGDSDRGWIIKAFDLVLSDNCGQWDIDIVCLSFLQFKRCILNFWCTIVVDIDSRSLLPLAHMGIACLDLPDEAVEELAKRVERKPKRKYFF